MDFDVLPPTPATVVGAPIRPVPSFNLQQIRARFQPEGMLNSSRSTPTFAVTQRENEQLIYYLWKEHPGMLHTEFCNHLHDVDAAIDYSHIIDPIKRFRGEKPRQQRMQEHSIQSLWKSISEDLGPGGTRHTTRTINVDAFTTNLVTYIEYIKTKVKADDVLMMFW